MSEGSYKRTTSVDTGHVNIAFENDPGALHEKIFEGTSVSTPASQNGEDDVPEREQWGSPVQFLMSCISLSVGLGNVWRFPYTAYSNGGGAFLIPYLIVLTIIGRPIYFLELALGQFSSFGPVKVWGLSPIFRGIGYGCMIGTICVQSYYAMIIGWTLFYLFASMQKELPWAVCDEKWINLGSGIIDTPSTVHETLKDRFECNSSYPGYVFEIENGTRSSVSLSQLYFENEVLKQKYQIDDGLGPIDWRLTLCLLLAWILIWAALVRGVKGSGKVAYFTALFPYIVLLIMFIRGVTLPNAWEGIKYFIVPKWEDMTGITVWFEAVGQCFFSLGISFGPLIMFGSYNDFKHNIYRDAWIVSGLDTFTSLFAGFTVFAVLGNLAGELGVDVGEVARGGAGLTFISFAQGLGTFTVVPQLFSILFYLMLLTLGIGTGVSLTGGIITIICDQFPRIPRWQVVTGVCTGGFCIGLLYVTPGGQFMLDLADHFGANFVLYMMGTLEVGAVAWVYGLNNFVNDLEFMLGIKLGWYWKICWGFASPCGLTVILVYILATEERRTFNDLAFPDWAIILGWMLAAVALMIIPALAIVSLVKSKADGFLGKLKDVSKPNKDWGPKKPKFRREWEAFKAKQS